MAPPLNSTPPIPRDDIRGSGPEDHRTGNKTLNNHREDTTMKRNQQTALTLALGSALAATLAAAPAAADNPFGSQSMGKGYMVAAMDGKCGGAAKAKDGKCGGAKAKDGKCGGAKGDAMKAEEGMTSAEKAKDGKCGEGKCGGAKAKAKDGKCGGAKGTDGKCGAKK